MAEEENGQEKTEEATPKRREKAREEGQVARSRELGTTLLLVGGTVSVLVFGNAIAERVQGVMKFNFNIDRQTATDPAKMFDQLSGSISQVMDIVVLILFLMMIAGVIGAIGVSGWLVSSKPLMPKLSRLNPIEGLKRMFSVKALVELVKAIFKFLLVALVAIIVLYQMQDNLLAIGQQALRPAVEHSAYIVIWSVIGMSISTLIIAAIDVPYQIFDNNKKLRMTHQQVKDEFKDSEGKPEVKSRIRQLQREMAQSRMMASIPEADVVITNPEHFSVALKYDMDSTGAPRVVAKGADEIAMKIREIANLTDVPLVQSPVLTRAIFYTTEIEDQIPETLYLAVAQVLAYIFQLRADKRMRPRTAAQSRAFDQRLDIPDDLLFNTDGDVADQAH